MTDIDVIVPVGVENRRPGDAARRRGEALRAAGYRPSFTYVLDGDVPEARAALAALARASKTTRA